MATFSLLYKHTTSNLVALGRTGEAVNSFFHGLTENLWLCSSLMCLLKKLKSRQRIFLVCFPETAICCCAALVPPSYEAKRASAAVGGETYSI